MSRDVLQAKREELKPKGLGNTPYRAEPIDFDQEEKLWIEEQLGGKMQKLCKIHCGILSWLSNREDS